jgi:hypothetical protein
MARGAAVIPESGLLGLGPPPQSPYPSYRVGAELDLWVADLFNANVFTACGQHLEIIGIDP